MSKNVVVKKPAGRSDGPAAEGAKPGRRPLTREQKDRRNELARARAESRRAAASGGSGASGRSKGQSRPAVTAGVGQCRGSGSGGKCGSGSGGKCGCGGGHDGGHGCGCSGHNGVDGLREALAGVGVDISTAGAPELSELSELLAVVAAALSGAGSPEGRFCECSGAVRGEYGCRHKYRGGGRVTLGDGGSALVVEVKGGLASDDVAWDIVRGLDMAKAYMQISHLIDSGRGDWWFS